MTKNDTANKAEKYLQTKYRFEIEEDVEEGGFIISYPDLPGCLSEGNTIEEAIKNGEDARKAWIYAAINNGMEVPMPSTSDDFSGRFSLRVPKSLHKRLAEKSKQEGVSMNQYCIYLLSQS